MYQLNETINTSKAGTIAGANAKDAYSYDYVTIETNEKFAIEYVDCYEALGFELVKSERSIALKTALTFKRNRKIQNKEQLKKIQIKLDEALKNMNSLEAKKTGLPTGAAVGLGVAGTLTLGGGMCLCLLNTAIGAIIGGAAVGLVGFGIMGLGYLAYKKLRAKRTAQINPLIDSKRDEISELCEEAQKYLN